MWPGTNIADGTRFLKVQFNDSVQSLPYSAKFKTALGMEFAGNGDGKARGVAILIKRE